MKNETKKSILDIDDEVFSALAAEWQLPAYAHGQLLSWLYQKRIKAFDEMSNFSKELRQLLNERFVIDPLELKAVQEGSDGTKKFLFGLSDGERIESVLIPNLEDERLTACVSSQVGCAMKCDFCRTGKMGFLRNLTAGEIVSQLRLMMQSSVPSVTNVVFMGMGEPLHNMEAVLEAVRLMLSPQAFGLGKRRITLSTSGLLPQLKRFTEEFDIKIAISLSATTDELRDRLMPINKRYPISEIMAFCREYSERSRHRIMFEYVLIAGVNDGEEDAERLVELLEGVRAKVNLIPMNPFEGCSYQRPLESKYLWWSNYLARNNITAPVRLSGGVDILAACGQLATSRVS